MTDFPVQGPAHFILHLKYPPSINNYYGITRSGTRFIKTPGVKYREHVVDVLRELREGSHTIAKPKRVQVFIEVMLPDNRVRDLDNLGKCLLDSLTGSVYEDDSQIADLRFTRIGVAKPGYVRVHISLLES